MNESINLNISGEELKKIIMTLSKEPFYQVTELINKINRQAQSQKPITDNEKLKGAGIPQV